MLARILLAIFICSCSLPVFAQAGTVGDPFIALGQAWHAPSSGIYYFSIDGTSFSTYVEAGSGWILIASGEGDTEEASYATTSALTLQSDQILSSSIYASALITDVRINATSGTDIPFDITSSASGILTNLRANRTLSVGTSTTDWSGTGTSYADPRCGSTDAGLNTRIYHSGCHGGGLHWLVADATGLEKVNIGASPNDLNLWIRAAAVALPVRFSYFEAELSSQNTVLLSWETSFETNNDFFTVERSANEETWEEITDLEAVGNSSTLQEYAVEDRFPQTGPSYYRIRQTDVDGKVSYSGTRAIKIEAALAPRLTLYPNPTSSILTIEGGDAGTANPKIYSLMGQDVSHLIHLNDQSMGIVVMDVSLLPSGIYTFLLGERSGVFYKQ
ncbi:MAG: T9SS type A sorting domain-containing protein [Bacteroidia bacterium]|nr:T9SS type A sorting domain-containing protein [Bacteroidia bacterium]